MRSHRVSSAHGAVACSAAIRAWRTYDAALGRERARVSDGVAEQPDGLGDVVVVPAGAVLVGEQHEAPVAHAGVAARVLEQHQGEQRHQRRLVGAQAQHDAHQPDRLGGGRRRAAGRARCRGRSRR